MSVIQVFNEVVHELLCTGELVNLKLIKSKTSHQVAVQGLTTSQVRSSEETLDMLTRAIGRHNTAMTTKNQTSSRSHFIFVVRVVRSLRGLGGDAFNKIGALRLCHAFLKKEPKAQAQNAELDRLPRGLWTAYPPPRLLSIDL
ncbi:hypothetical protein PHYSODRAFT_302798 [Phytophthora sojae]|uniref:Kinesin motor domain-containing protein n=1 Tax=Phytophthora sojae (strain P6497) TaxID=1094619 RepID=G4ZSB7_PHYSP|nr:hypothetical protein PHYSODRAFT_302798 [Phytophthora sojae]EGZ13013.1 hypothetical protein PHYSODRAFT_302798 [Phytophthora sojae]|eukprot:XP_009530442.1 hypothetical protein PHYSODRAFT_302798 [Phytophthora sojae]